MTKLIKITSLMTLALGFSACGGEGGGASDSNTDLMILQGTLTERGGVDDSLTIDLKHEIGERIGEVKICLQGQCSVTDSMGQWGFEAPKEFKGGDAPLSVVGHGIATSVSVSIPSGAHDVVIDLGHNRGEVSIEHLDVDGRNVIDSDSQEHPHS